MDDPDIEPFLQMFLLIQGSSIQILPEIILASSVIIILLICSALISASEVAFFSLTPAQIREIRSNDSKINKPAITILETPKLLLATILIANNFVNVAIVIISTFETSRLFDFKDTPVLAFVIQGLLITSLILLFGEITPKMYATNHNLKVVRVLSPMIQILIRIAKPLSLILMYSTSFVEKRIQKKNSLISIDEISEAIDISTDHSGHEEEKKLLKGIVKFSDIEVNEVMTPRIDITAIDENLTFDKLIALIIDTGYSRIPVYDGNLDKITGVLYVKDLLPHSGENAGFNWQTLVRPAFFIPENKKINDLLEEFQLKKIHLAVVVDEYGGTSGIVTLEDILEEIVGEISDEFDTADDNVEFVRIDDYNFIFEGKTSLIDFYKILNLDNDIFDKVKGTAESLAGLVIELMGRIPQKNESVTYHQFTFKVEVADLRRVKRIKVSVKNDSDHE